MTTAATLQTFNQCAIAHRFTGIQTQLWQCLYWLVHTYGQGVCIPTYHLLDTMGISRSQLTRARNALVSAGCLQMHKTNAQRTHYTLMIDGKPIDTDTTVGAGSARPNTGSARPNTGSARPNTGSACPFEGMHTSKKHGKTNAKNHGTGNDKKHGTANPSPTAPTGKDKKSCKSVPTGVAPQPDIVMNGEIEKQVDAFVAQHGYSRAVRHKLLEWCRMRRQHCWTLTEIGFNGTMNTLLQHSGGEESLMIKIIDRTLTHQWKGFFAYKMDPISHGMYQKSTGKIPKYDTKKEDLDFLEW